MSGRNAVYWTIVPGQLRDGERVDTGHRTEDAARYKSARLPGSRVALLETVEHDLPNDDPHHEPFSSVRWCVVVQDDGVAWAF